MLSSSGFEQYFVHVPVWIGERLGREIPSLYSTAVFIAKPHEPKGECIMVKRISITCALVLLSSALVVITSANDNNEGPFTLRGSWLIVDDNTGARFLGAFTEDGIHLLSAGQVGSSTAYGAWKQTGLRTFSSTVIAFVFDDEGITQFIQKGIAAPKLARDGQSFTSPLVIEISTPDGTVVNTIQTTISGQRINPEPLP
jgi:hypothetical protein